MGPTVSSLAPAAHLSRLEGAPAVMAKADLKKRETPWRVQVGHAIQRCFALAGVSQKEGAALLNRDPAQIARWMSGDERAQLDAIFAVDRLRQPIVIALAELAGEGVTITTMVQIKRLA